MNSANIIDPRQLAAMAHEDLACYSTAQWPQFERAHHHELIISRLEAIERGELEANYINAEIHPPSQEQDGMAPITSELGFSTGVGALSAINLVSGFQRYETAIENKLYRAIHELERRQRMRKGEFVPAPQSLDVSIHSERERET